jgi:hypothetical protein
MFRMGGYMAVDMELDAGFGCCCCNCFWSKLIFPIRLLEGATTEGSADRAAAAPVFVPTTAVDFLLCPEVDPVPSSRERLLPVP